jgi:protein TonB
VDVLENPGYGFVDAALEAVRKSRFLPAHVGDRPIACRVRLPIRFVLQTGS